MDPRGMLQLWDDDDHLRSPVAEHFRDKVVLLTGATGFLGQLYANKLIRCGVGELILIIREKRGVEPQRRMQECFDSSPVMKSFQENVNHCRRKIRLVQGDMETEGLGMSSDDADYIRERTQIVIHAAADVRFDETLIKAIQINVMGTWEMLKLCVECRQLEQFVYVSTAYANCIQGIVYEQFYEPPMDPFVMMELVKNIKDEDEFEALTTLIIKPWPNTYTYAKALAENLVKQFYDRMNVMIIRPPIVVATFKEPVQGWADNLYGMNGVIVGIGMGVLRVIQTGAEDMINDIMPADFVVNGTLAAVKYTTDRNALDRPSLEPSKVAIYHITSGLENPLTNAHFRELVETIGSDHPPLNSFWIGTCFNLQSKLAVRVLTILFHVIPGMIIDAILQYNGKRPRLMKVYRKVAKFTGFISYFATHEFIFINEKMRMIHNSMEPDDREMFSCDIKSVTWEDVFNVYCPGLKLYMLKEGPNTWIDSRKRFKRLKKLGLGFIRLMLAGLLYLIIRWLLSKLL